MNRITAQFFISSLTGFPDAMLRKALESLMPEELFSVPAEKLFSLGITPNLYQAEEYEKLRHEELLLEKMERMREKGVRYIPSFDPSYPERLSVLPDPPFGLFVRGELPDPERPAAAVVGSRRCTVYGREAAYYFGKELSKAKISVISGMALGVDGYAQTGALQGIGNSFAVLGGGADICYPAENVGLYADLQKNGNGVISERPCGYRARAYDFPVRNRLISALSDVLIVIEAAVHSGSLISVNHALSQGKEIFALPGRVGDRMSEGCNQLIRDGAGILLEPGDIFQALGLKEKKTEKMKQRVFLCKEEKVIFDYIGRTPVTVEELLQRSSYPVSSLLEVLLKLEIRGLIKKADLSGYVVV